MTEQTSIERHQRNGVAWDIIAEAVNSWDEWMLDDDYDAMGALNRIMSRMKKRAAFYKFGDGECETEK